MIGRVTALTLAVALGAVPVAAQEPDLAPRVGPAGWCSTEGCEDAGIAAALHQWECHLWRGPTCSLDALAGRDSGGFGAFGELTERPVDLGMLPIVPPGTWGRLHIGLTATAPYSEIDQAEWALGVGLKVTLTP